MFKGIRLYLIALFVFIPAVFVSSQSEYDNEKLLARAEAAFAEGNEQLQNDPAAAKESYLKAVNYYNSIIESGIENAKLLYNIANAYVRLEEYGNAILNYRKALLYAPNDQQIKYNLEYARSLQKNGFVINTENEVLHILFFWHYLMPPLWKFIVLIAANLLFWSTLVLGRFGRSVWKAAVLSAIITVMIGGSLYLDTRSLKELHGVVVSDSTIGRLGDSRSYEPAFDAPLYDGVEFTVRQRRVGWILAELTDGGLVWLEEQDCGIIER